MEPVEKAIIELNYKVEQVQKDVEKLTFYITNFVSEKKQSTELEVTGEIVSELVELIPSSPDDHLHNHQFISEHKDILVDRDYWEHDNYHYGNSNQHQPYQSRISSEVQIQRLTAQLTAAYNRIAALEEQLLSRQNQYNHK